MRRAVGYLSRDAQPKMMYPLALDLGGPSASPSRRSINGAKHLCHNEIATMHT